MARNRRIKTDLIYDYLREASQLARDEGKQVLELTPEQVAVGAGLSTLGDDYLMVCQALLAKEELTIHTRLRLQPLRFRML